MSDKLVHTLNFCNNMLTVGGVARVVAISEKEAQLKLSGGMLVVKGSGLNIVRLDKQQGTLQLETQSLANIAYRQTGVEGLKGLFK